MPQFKEHRKNIKMSIQADLTELNGIERELKSLRMKTKSLNLRKKEVTARITAYIRSKDLPGVKHQGTAVLLEEKTKRMRKPVKQQDQDVIMILKNYGVNNPEMAFQEIMDARKGEEIPVDKLKVKKYKNPN